jgi:hypothetical protein
MGVLDDHVAAFFALAQGNAELGADVFEGEVLNGPERYASVWPSNGIRAAERLDLAQIQISPTFTVHSVGKTPSQARWVADRVTLQVLGVRPTVPGRKCWPIRLAASQPIQLDRNINPHLWYGVDVFQFTSTPARTTT